MDKCNKIEFRNGTTYTWSIDFHKCAKTIEKRRIFFFFLTSGAGTIGCMYTKQKKRTLIQFLNLHHMQKLTQNVLYRHMRYKCKTCL